MQPLMKEQIQNLIKTFLKEDISHIDVTTEELISSNKMIEANLIIKEPCCLSGLEIFEMVFQILDPAIEIINHFKDGDILTSGEVVYLRGNAWPILKGERTALNLISHLSGVASITKKYVDAIKGTDAHIFDTRKTIPGLRMLEKKAVIDGGGNNHRMGLYDMVLIKDNHLKLLNDYTPEALKYMIDSIRHKYPKMLIEMEVDELAQIDLALKVGCDIILLDNMSYGLMREAITIIGSQAQVEASGGITLDNVRQVAETGVDRISIGALTHSVRSIDFSLEIKF